MSCTSWKLGWLAFASLVSVACSGGPGALPDLGNGWDNRAGDFESTNENAIDPPRRRIDPLIPRNERAPSDRQFEAPSTRFACEGIYICTAFFEGRTVNGPLELESKPGGVCELGDTFILADNNVLYGEGKDGQRIAAGSWKGSDGSLIITVGDLVVTCKRYTGAEVFDLKDLAQSSTTTTSPDAGSRADE